MFKNQVNIHLNQPYQGSVWILSKKEETFFNKTFLVGCKKMENKESSVQSQSKEKDWDQNSKVSNKSQDQDLNCIKIVISGIGYMIVELNKNGLKVKK